MIYTEGFPTFTLGWILEGVGIPNPSCYAGRLKRSHSRLFDGCHPIIAGIRFVLSNSSRGTSKWLFGIARLTYVHLLSKPCVRAVKAA